MVHADYLCLLTDVDCLYSKNPRTHPDAEPIEVVSDISTLEADISSAGTSLGTGGMSTKIVAARLATSAGVTTVIARSSSPGNIINIISHVQAQKQTGSSTPSPLPHTPPLSDSDLTKSTSSLHLFDLLAPVPLHTRFLPDPHPIRDHSFWLLHGLAPHGTLFIDEGAHRALTRKAGLLPVGVVDVQGDFSQYEAVSLVVVKDDAKPLEVGRALVVYSAAECLRIKGCQSAEIEGKLGYCESEYVALRENVSLVRREKDRPVTPSSGTPSSGGAV